MNVDPFDLLRLLNVALAAHGLVLMWALRRLFAREGEHERLALMGFALMWLVMLYASIESVGVNAPAGARIPLISVALLLTSVGLHRIRRAHRD